LSLQILNFGHWRDGSAGTVGEEQEQVFSTFSSYSNSTKTMGAASMEWFLLLLSLMTDISNC